jgi:hypothetical protein
MMLGMESQRVVTLRVMKLGRGGSAAQSEFARMISEKPAALAEAATAAMTGRSANAIVRRYRAHVKANARRLHRG